MKFNIKYLSMFMSVLCLFAACADDDDDDSTDTNSCFISAVTLGTLSRTIVQTDTTYQVSVTGSYYPMTIDHIKGEIYNIDSLPYNTNVEKVVFSTLNAQGTLALKSLFSGEDTLFVSTDSTDFRQPRQITVYGTDGISRRQYTMTLNVHREEGDSMNWQRVTNFDPSTIPATTDCTAWMREIQAVSTDDAPVSDVCGVKRTSRFDPQIEEILVVGTNSGNQNVTWKKLVDLTGNETFTWQQMYNTDEIPDSLKMPEVTSKNLMIYDEGALLVGVKDGTIDCRYSGDFGRTWSAEAFSTPKFTEGATAVKAWMDDDKFVWIYCKGTNETWRGRLNKFGWKDVQTEFLKIRKK